MFFLGFSCKLINRIDCGVDKRGIVLEFVSFCIFLIVLSLLLFSSFLIELVIFFYLKFFSRLLFCLVFVFNLIILFLCLLIIVFCFIVLNGVRFMSDLFSVNDFCICVYFIIRDFGGFIVVGIRFDVFLLWGGCGCVLSGWCSIYLEVNVLDELLFIE